MFDIKDCAKKLIDGGVMGSKSGVKMYTPDGQGRYASHWTRDFAYMVEDAGELIPLQDIKEGIQYLIDGVREDGWIPDRVDGAGEPWYTAGGRNELEALPNIDNGQFLCLVAGAYLSRIPKEQAIEQFKEWKDTLQRGIDCLDTDENGIVDNSSVPPHSPYGFTDTVQKTGLLCMETLLLWRAKKILITWLKESGFDFEKYQKDCENIERTFLDVFLMENGTFRAATGKCNQSDIWATCYAVSIGFPLPEKIKDGIVTYFVENYEFIVQDGQLRHLPAGEFWQECLVGVVVPEGTYQNGAFWAVPIKWLCDTLILRSEKLVKKTLQDVLTYFEKFGVYECVNGEYRQLDTYVASATAVFGAYKSYGWLL